MNKSPPTTGGLFYFGQIAYHAIKRGSGSRYMRKVRSFTGTETPRFRAAGIENTAPDSGRSA